MNRRGFFGFLGKTAAAVAAAPVVAKAADAVERVQTVVPPAVTPPPAAPVVTFDGAADKDMAEIQTAFRDGLSGPLWVMSTSPYYIGCASTLAVATHYPIYLSTSYYSSCLERMDE